MEYLPNKSLSDEIKGKLPGHFNELMIAKITRSVLETLRFLK
jgi:hypothetical protein